MIFFSPADRIKMDYYGYWIKRKENIRWTFIDCYSVNMLIQVFFTVFCGCPLTPSSAVCTSWFIVFSGVLVCTWGLYSLCVCLSLIASHSQWLISDTSRMRSYLCQWREGGLDQALSVFRHSVWKCHRQPLQIQQREQISSAASHHATIQHSSTLKTNSSQIIYNL